MRQVVHVESTGCHIGSHEQLHGVLAELLHGQVALLLAQVAVQGLGIVAVAYQLVGYLLGFQLGAAEDDGKNLGIVVHNALQGQVLVLRLHHIIKVVDVLGALVTAADNNSLVILKVLLGHSLHLAAHGGREHQRGVIVGQCLEDFIDAVGETHVQHLVGLVEHNVGHLLQMGKATVLEVNESARRSHDNLDNLHALLQRTHLRLDGSTAIDRLHVDAVHVLRKVTQIVGYLQAQLSGRTEHQRLGGAARQVDALQQRDAECRRLARTRLGKGYHVASHSQQIRNYRLLYRHGLYKSHLFNGAANLFADAQFIKCLHLGCKDTKKRGNYFLFSLIFRNFGYISSMEVILLTKLFKGGGGNANYSHNFSTFAAKSSINHVRPRISGRCILYDALCSSGGLEFGCQLLSVISPSQCLCRRH